MRHQLHLKDRPWTTVLLWLGALFFLFEFFLHIFGLPILEHDRIFLYTHDGYIGLYALTYTFLLILVSLNLREYSVLFYAVMIGLGLGFVNGNYVSFKGGYEVLFPVVSLDSNLPLLGILFLLWYISVWIFWWLKK